MSDSLPGRSGEFGAGRPLTPAEFKLREQGRQALSLWVEGKTAAQIAKAMNLRDRDAAEELINRGSRDYMDEDKAAEGRWHALVDADILRARAALLERVDEGYIPAIEALGKIDDRIARVKQIGKDGEATGPQIQFIDNRHPWEREPPQIVDAEPPEQIEGPPTPDGE